MDLKSGYPFWLAKHGLPYDYPKLMADADAEVVVIGGGIAGALIAYTLTKAGHSVLVVDRRYIGWGSTSASTALLQYEIDTHLTDLAEMIGEADAELAYHACRDAIDQAEQFCNEVGGGHFTRKQSFYFASKNRDIPRLEKEYQARERAGFRVAWWDQQQIAAHFDLPAPAGIMSAEAAEMDALHLTHALHQKAIQQGQRVYERTTIDKLTPHETGVTLQTTTGQTLSAKHVVIACGYESLQFVNECVVDLNSSYALVSEPIVDFPGWYERCLLWESARPYIYARTTSDNRVILGGEDIRFRNPRARDRKMPRKTRRLERRWQKMFPRIPLETAFYWSGTFGETKDGLPYIGYHPAHPHQFFALCFGGNGITFSMVAAEMARAALAGKQHRCTHLFRFDR